jgi:hypothetical protein
MTLVQLTPEQAKSIGTLLKSAREQQGKSIADAAYQIALSPAQLRAIEAADLKPFYSQSFFHQAAERYAKYLNVALPEIAVVTAIVTNEPNDTNVKREIVAEQLAPEPAPEPVASPVAMPSPAATSAAVKPNKKTPMWPAFALAAGIAVVAITVGVHRDPVAPIASPQDKVANVAPASNENANPSSVTAAATAAPSPNVSATVPNVANGSANKPADAAEKADSLLESAATAWVQIVKKNGDKANLKIEPGNKIEFTSSNTAAIVFGQPDKARLLVKGKAVDISRFVTPDNPSRALVILNQIP